MKEKIKLNPLQKLFLKEANVSTRKLREFYGKMIDDPKVPSEFKAKGMTPERVASDYLEVLRGKNDLQSRRKKLMCVHEFEENGKKYRLNVLQGFLSDYEICYPATRFILEKDGKLVKDTTIGANFFDETEMAELFEYARLMYGEKTYAYLMELAAKKVEVLPEAECDASSDGTHRSNQGKFNRFMKLDKIARKMYKEVKEINRENEAYIRTRKFVDEKNDYRKIQFEDLIIVNPKPTEPEDKDIPPRAKPDTERIVE